ncbi:hypothetical protein HMPREF1544_03008 [Mucor circinelloides 1006PhL]|uniref:Uncharacterized protein n=1 Tax=Mucor circinelloides f. circinelloides (strain 1006PhL) TaxID=1220926 RepID=S2JJQ7_MUCC1|nr:hypothetical protein HMPREF1544_03008 [Mucor circinelloides 1006PhL]KAG1106423.1 hypothetical protein G6F42_016759 [Rhizopus arrhizus]
MHKRQFHNKDSKYAALQDDSKSKRAKKNPIQQVVSTLPQLAISFAILFFAGTQFQSGISQVGGVAFYVSLLAGLVICGVFLVLQVQGAEYKNWQQDPTTRQYIQIASISTMVSFFGFNYSLWSVFGILTPMIIVCGFVFVMSILMLITAFL